MEERTGRAEGRIGIKNEEPTWAATQTDPVSLQVLGWPQNPNYIVNSAWRRLAEVAHLLLFLNNTALDTPNPRRNKGARIGRCTNGSVPLLCRCRTPRTPNTLNGLKEKMCKVSSSRSSHTDCENTRENQFQYKRSKQKWRGSKNMSDEEQRGGSWIQMNEKSPLREVAPTQGPPGGISFLGRI